MEYISKDQQQKNALRKAELLFAENEQLKADLDYVAMVANVNLDEGENNDEQALHED